jgi:glycogen(starch) synthase
LKVLNLTWEFPPWKVGGIATYLLGLGKSLQGKGIEIHVICPGPESNYEVLDGIHVHRFKADFPSNDFIAWVLQMNFFMKNKITEVWKECGGFDLIHTHDWMGAMPAIFAKETYKVPIVTTMHATEQGRWGKGQGIQLINELEYKLTYESWKITVLSDYMKWELQDLFGVPQDKIWVIPPGINPWEYQFQYDYWGIRNRFAAPFERIVLFIGRMFPQKGCDILVGAAPDILSEFPNTKFVCVGEGFERMRCTDLANWLGVGHKFFFTGYLDDYTAKALMQMADVLVVPSRHEPFGLVPLEGMAAKTPVVVSDEGGMHSTVEHDVNGFKAWKESSESIAFGVRKILRDPNYASCLVENGLKTLYERFDWNKNSDIMKNCYEEILKGYQKTEWSKSKVAISGS